MQIPVRKKYSSRTEKFGRESRGILETWYLRRPRAENGVIELPANTPSLPDQECPSSLYDSMGFQFLSHPRDGGSDLGRIVVLHDLDGRVQDLLHEIHGDINDKPLRGRHE